MAGMWEIDDLTRRSFIERAGLLAGLAAFAQLPGLLGPKGLLEEAAAQELDVVRDTLSGVLAFVLPGDDEYSVAQGESAPGPGAVGAGILDPLITALDHFVPAEVPLVGEQTLPASGAVALLLNDFALQVNPTASSGPFLSPFARLTFKEKAEAFNRFENDRTITDAVPELKFVGSITHGYVAFLAFSEAGVLDPATRKLTATPVGWQIARYGGPTDGHAEFKGYFQGRKSVVRAGAKRRRRRRKRRRRRED